MKFWIQHTPDVLIERFGNMLNICKDLVDNFFRGIDKRIGQDNESKMNYFTTKYPLIPPYFIELGVHDT